MCESLRIRASKTIDCKQNEKQLSNASRERKSIMLCKVSELKGYTLDSLNGKIGEVKEFYFDDRLWTMRSVMLKILSSMTKPGRFVI